MKLMLLTSRMTTGVQHRRLSIMATSSCHMITHIDTLLYIVDVFLFMPVFQQILQET